MKSNKDCCQTAVTLVITSLDSGGAEKVAATLANQWCRRGWAITLLVFVDETFIPHFELHPEVKYLPLNIYLEEKSLLKRALNGFKRIIILRKAIKKSDPDVVVSFMDRVNVVTLLSCMGLQYPVIVSEHCNPYFAPNSTLWNQVRCFFYRRALAVTVLSERIRPFFPPNLQSKIHVLPNPIQVNYISKGQSKCPSGRKKIISGGRLSHEKGFDLLLHAFAKIHGKFPDWRLEIFGEGPLRRQLEDLSLDLNLKDSVRFLGLISSPEPVFETAEMFVLSSRTEGFPMVLCEAMACGLPVVATDCPTGPKEIVRDNIDGLLVAVESVDALATGMAEMMSDYNLRRRLAKRAPEIVDRFSLDSVLQLWDEILPPCMF